MKGPSEDGIHWTPPMSIWIDGLELTTDGRYVKYARVASECYELITNPEALIDGLKARRVGVDILTFGQRVPDVEPRYSYYFDWQEIAVLRISTYENWLTNQIIKENKKNVAKASKRGVEVDIVEFNDDLVRGIMDIYDETPIRQGKKFWHYRKDFMTVKRENGTYLESSVFIGAYFERRLIGFLKIFLTEHCASTIQVISKIGHRDKKPTNALLAKAVEICASGNIPYLQYGLWITDTLGDFKRYNGFERMVVPLYYVPLTSIGKLVLAMKLQHGIRNILPNRLIAELKDARRKWYARKVHN